MRLVEKKCPNCGAALEFDENAKSCKCNYCKRSFEIERDLNDVEKFNLIYDKIQQPMNKAMTIPIIIVGAFIFIVAAIIIFSSISTHNSTSDKDFEIPDVNDILEDQNKLISDVSELTNANIDIIKSKCHSVIHQSVVGRNDTTYSYKITGDPRVEKMIVAANDDSNVLIVIYSVIYHNFFNQTDQKTVYVPVVFENVSSSVFSLTSGNNPAPEYYLNDDHSSYIYAYGSYDEAYNNVVNPYKDGYKITEK